MVSALASSSLLERKVSPKALKALVRDWDLLKKKNTNNKKSEMIGHRECYTISHVYSMSYTCIAEYTHVFITEIPSYAD